MVAVNQSDGNAQNQDLPIASAFFGAVAGLTNAAAQNVPPGTGAQTSLTSTAGIIVSRPGVTLTRMRVRFVGDAANVAGQTLTFQLLRSTDGGLNFSAVAAAVVAGLATTAGSKVGTVDFTATPLGLNDGNILRVTSTPSAALTVAVSDISVSLS